MWRGPWRNILSKSERPRVPSKNLEAEGDSPEAARRSLESKGFFVFEAETRTRPRLTVQTAGVFRRSHQPAGPARLQPGAPCPRASRASDHRLPGPAPRAKPAAAVAEPVGGSAGGCEGRRGPVCGHGQTPGCLQPVVRGVTPRRRAERELRGRPHPVCGVPEANPGPTPAPAGGPHLSADLGCGLPGGHSVSLGIRGPDLQSDLRRHGCATPRGNPCSHHHHGAAPECPSVGLPRALRGGSWACGVGVGPREGSG